MSQSRPHVDHSAVAESINAAINYTMYAVFREVRPGAAAVHGAAAAHGAAARDASAAGPAAASAPGAGSGAAAESVAAPGSVAALGDRLRAIDGLVTRGWYDVSGFRADADLLVWWHAPTAEALQRAYREVLDWARGGLEPVWSSIGLHRAAEFNRGHVPGFLAGEEPRAYLCVYPFVRSREWYLLPDDDRRRMLREHGAAARNYGDVIANTVASFALGDYEWLLGFEANELYRLVDVMRELRATDARRHVIEETPFFTGPRVTAEAALGRVAPGAA